nr:MAG TPA: hypothetical protein [Caudoviricetes sp.]
MLRKGPIIARYLVVRWHPGAHPAAPSDATTHP